MTTLKTMTTIANIKQAKKASYGLINLEDAQISEILLHVADTLEADTEKILKANAIDMGRMQPDNPKRDRLLLTSSRIKAIADDMRAVALLPSPRKVIDTRIRPNGLEITRIAVPFGLIGVIFEARPNVTADVFSLCFKSGNACVLKGGHDADVSNAAIAESIHHALAERNVDTSVMTLLPSTREAGEIMMTARGIVDVIIPRGSHQLIDSVRAHSSVPVIETGAGVCHTYVDKDADIEKASAIINNAKTRRVSVCNALDCAIIHSSKVADLPAICTPLEKNDVAIYADERAYDALKDNYPERLLHRAQAEDFGREFLSYAMAIKTVDNIAEAIDHIGRFGSGHSEAIVTEDNLAADCFCRNVDAACVYVNAPTSFTDGAQFGLGAEIGISTQKLHARGPMGLDQLMTYKWIIRGNGQTRP